MAIAKLSIDLEARLTKLEAGLKQATSMAEKSAGQMQKAFSGLALTFTGLAGALSIGALKGAFDKYVDGAASMQKLAVVTGTTTESISALVSVARLSSTEVGQVEAGMVRLAAALSKAGEESKGAGKAFALLELDPEKLRKMGTAEALQAVAKAFSEVEEGSSKTALAVAIFGKAGAELLPYLADLAANGQLVAKITTEQGQAAKEYEQSLRKLEAAKSAVSKTISAELVPAATVFVKTLADLVSKSNEVGGAVKGLAADNSIRSWAQSGAIAVANLIDAFQLLKGIAVEVGTPIERIGRNIYTVGALAGIATKGSLSEKSQAFDALKKENEAYFANLDKRLENNRKPAVLFSEKIKAAFDAGPKSSAKAARRVVDFRPEPSEGKTSSGRSASGKAFDDGQRLVQQLKDRILATQNLTEVEKLEAAIADGKYKTATAANLETAKGYAQTLDNINASRTEAEAELEVQRKRLEVFADGARVMESVRTPVEALDAEIAHLVTLLGDGAISMETFGRAASKAGEQFQAIESDAETTSKGLSAFAKSAAKNMQTAFADFLFDPFEKGTQSMLQSFGETVRRMIANAVSADLMNRLFGDLSKQGGSVGGLVGKGLGWLSKILSVAGGGGGFGAEDFANLAASHIDSAKGNIFSSPALSAYSGSVVSRPTIFPFARGVGLMGEAGPEAILPLSRGSDGKLGVRGGGHSVSVVINMGGNSGAADVRRSGGAVAREVLGALSAAGRYR